MKKNNESNKTMDGGFEFRYPMGSKHVQVKMLTTSHILALSNDIMAFMY